MKSSVFIVKIPLDFLLSLCYNKVDINHNVSYTLCKNELKLKGKCDLMRWATGISGLCEELMCLSDKVFSPSALGNKNKTISSYHSAYHVKMILDAAYGILTDHMSSLEKSDLVDYIDAMIALEEMIYKIDFVESRKFYSCVIDLPLSTVKSRIKATIAAVMFVTNYSLFVD